jgi:hypothetical protein
MLVNDKCSIYEHRAQTCRSYDCRVFTATGVPVDEKTQAEIGRRVQQWVFRYESDDSREEHRTLNEAAAFLRHNKDLFPPGPCPTSPRNWRRSSSESTEHSVMRRERVRPQCPMPRSPEPS